MKKGSMEFVERFGADGDTMVVRRNVAYDDNAMLPSIHSARVGEKIVRYFLIY